MRRFPCALVTVLALVGSSGVAGCEPPTYPGESLGTFDVVGSLEENACGDTAVPALDPLTFAVELRADGALAYWHRAKQPLTTGVVMSNGALRFRTESYVPVLDPDPATGYPGCALVQTEVIEMTIDGFPTADGGAAGGDGGGDGSGDGGVDEDGGGVETDARGDAGADAREDAGADAREDAGADAGAARTLTGENEIRFASDPSGDCTPILAALGGPFLAVPCTVRYTLRGRAEPTDAP